VETQRFTHAQEEEVGTSTNTVSIQESFKVVQEESFFSKECELCSPR
jgi:hypothetical protein